MLAYGQRGWPAGEDVDTGQTPGWRDNGTDKIKTVPSLQAMLRFIKCIK